MRILILSLAVLVTIGVLPATLAADYKDWVAQGYRWSLVSGLHAYISKDDAKNDRSRHDRSSVSEKVRYAYYLRPGKLVLVVGTDSAEDLCQIRMGGIASDLWTANKYLSTRPVRNSVAKIETPPITGTLPITMAAPGRGSAAKPGGNAEAYPR